MGGIAADGTAVCFHRPVFQPAAGKDGAVGIVHFLISHIQPSRIGIKGIGIFHDKFPAAHQAKTGSLFIPEFALDLVQVHRQLAVGTQVVPHQRSNQFFVGRSQAELTAMTVFDPEHFFAVDGPAAAFFPDFSRLQNGHHNFLGTLSVHFLPDNGFNLFDASPGQGQVGIQTAGSLAQITGPEHQFVALDNRLRRNLS